MLDDFNWSVRDTFHDKVRASLQHSIYEAPPPEVGRRIRAPPRARTPLTTILPMDVVATWRAGHDVQVGQTAPPSHDQTSFEKIV